MTHPHRYGPLAVTPIGAYCRCRDCGEVGTIADEAAPGPCLARTVRVYEARLAVYREAIAEALAHLTPHSDAHRTLKAADLDAEAAAVLAGEED